MMFMRKIIFALALLFAPSFAFAANCTNGTIITAPGAGNCTVPSGITSMTFWAWGGGASGANEAIGGNAGPGGGFCKITLTVTPGNTVYYSVAAAVTGGSNTGVSGNTSWTNISANAQPSSLSNGCYASGGNSSGNVGGAPGPSGASGYTGGNATAPGSSDGGGGGAGSGGNGGNSNGTGGGIGGTPDGGRGGNYSGNSTGFAGTAPGGGGGASSFDAGGNGARGQIEISWGVAPASTPFIFIPAIIP